MSQCRCGIAAIVGSPNVGKSTLLNRIAGSKVSIVTHKVQTTRTVVRCVVTRGRTQIICVDTPGLFTPGRRLERAMVTAAHAAARDADCLILLLDGRALVSGGDEAVLQHERLFRSVQGHGRPLVVAINRIDQMYKPHLLSVAAGVRRMHDGHILMISALTGDGVEELLNLSASMMPVSVHLYADGDSVGDVGFLACELVRESAMLRLHQELPYRLTVETVSCIERDNDIHVSCRIVLAEERHKPMVIGRRGSMLKHIGQRARTELADILGRPVHLTTEIVIRPGWQDDRRIYERMGLDF